MAYEVYIDDMLLPIPPQKIPIKYPGQNKSANLINGQEINITKPAGLAEISLDIIFPQMNYPAAVDVYKRQMLWRHMFPQWPRRFQMQWLKRPWS